MVVSKSRECCSLENQRLKNEIRKCDFCSADWEEHHQCLRHAARESGERARSCIFE